MENSNTVKRIVRRKKTLSRMAAGCISLILVVLGATYYRGLSSRTVEDTSVIISAKAKLGDVKTSITSSGTIEGVEAFSIRLPEGIKIKKILVSEGDAVKKGTKIASIAKASAADVLLTVRESVDTLEDSIEALDDDALTDKDSDDYLKKISYEGQLSDLKELKSSLEEILDSGYITASDAGIVSTLYISAEEEVGSTTQTGNTSSDNSDAAATSAVKTSYSAAVQTKPLFFSNVTSSEAVIMATSKASDTKISSTSEPEDDTSALQEGSKKMLLTQSGNADQSSTEEATVSPSDSVTQQPSDQSDSSSQQPSDQSDSSSQQPSDQSDSSSQQSSDQSDSSSQQSSDQSDSSSQQSSDQSDSSSQQSSDQSDSSSQQSSDQSDSSSQQSKNQNTGTNTQNTTTNQNKQKTNNSSMGTPSMSSQGSIASSSGGGTTADTTETIGGITLVKAAEFHSNTQVAVNVSVDETDIESVKIGQTATLTLSALSDQTFEGTVSTISGADSESGGSVKYTVTILLDKKDGMRNGMSASAVINVEEASDTLTIPASAVQENNGSAFVYTKKDKEGNLSGETKVTTGLSDGATVQITEGLDEGDTVYYSISQSRKNSDNEGNDQNHFGNGPEGMPGGGTPPSEGSGGIGGNRGPNGSGGGKND